MFYTLYEAYEIQKQGGSSWDEIGVGTILGSGNFLNVAN